MLNLQTAEGLRSDMRPNAASVKDVPCIVASVAGIAHATTAILVTRDHVFVASILATQIRVSTGSFQGHWPHDDQPPSQKMHGQVYLGPRPVAAIRSCARCTLTANWLY